mmetsp:Transcript_111663/g.204826  ORF Transcript_111663/g.204826 Transcript_111663/m.204826 type:complete len:261 (-) Transcript_111663:1225-2007(-)
MKEAIGLFGSFNPERDRRTAFATATTASSWPMTRSCRVFSKSIKRADSSADTFSTLMPVISATTRSTSESATKMFWATSSGFVVFMFASSASSASFFFFSSAASPYSFSATALSIISSISFTSARFSRVSSGTCLACNSLTRAPVSSSRSIALSGKYRSATYWSASFTHASRASGVYWSWWCSSYLYTRPFRISTASSFVGSGTLTVWKRRSRALSFSMYLRYSSMVVAPMSCRSPFASIGFIIFPASMDPSALPAPTTM